MPLVHGLNMWKWPRLHKTLRNTFSFYVNEIWDPCRTAELEDHRLSAVRDYFSVSGGFLLIRYLGKAHVLVAWTRQLKASVNKLGILKSESWLFRTVAVMSAVFRDVMPFNPVKITIVLEENTMFIVCFKDGASETSVNLCQITVDLMIRLRAGWLKNRGLILGVSKTFICFHGAYTDSVTTQLPVHWALSPVLWRVRRVRREAI